MEFELYDYEIEFTDCGKHYTETSACCINGEFAIGFAILQHDTKYKTLTEQQINTLIEIIESGIRKNLNTWLKMHGFSITKIKKTRIF